MIQFIFNILSDKHMAGACDIFWIKSINETLALKNSNYKQGLESAILAIFQRGLGWPCPASMALKNPLLGFKHSFWGGSYEFLAMLKGKVRKSSFF